MSSEKIKLDDAWIFINSYFEEPDALISHQIESFNQFINELPIIFSEENPIEVVTDVKTDDENKINKINKIKHIIEYKKINIYKPYINEINGKKKPILPNECRLRNLTYQSNIYGDIYHKIIYYNDDKIVKEDENSLNLKLGSVPIMLRSEACILSNFSPYQYLQIDECRYDPGGYFIVNGNEKIIIGQERLNDNHVYLFKNKGINQKYPYTCEIRSRVESKFENPIITLIKYEKSGQIYIVCKPGWPKEDVPLFIFLRALGLESDNEIIKYIAYDMNDEKLINELKPSINYELEIKDKLKNSEGKQIIIRNQEDALLYMANRASIMPKYLEKNTNEEKIKYILDKINKHLLPHVGDNLIKKIYFIGFMVNKLLKGKLNRIAVDQRDNYGNKRIDVSGILLSKLMRQLVKQQAEWMKMSINKEFNNKTFKEHDVKTVLSRIVKSSIIESKIKKALSTGDFDPKGTNPYTRGVAQSLTRRSYCDTISYLRRVNTPVGKGVETVLDTRRLQCTHWGMLCPAETPEGPTIGFTKHLSLMTRITKMHKSDQIKLFLEEFEILKLEEIPPTQVQYYTKCFVNGNWFACVENSKLIVKELKKARRKGILNIEISIVWDTMNNEIRIYSDSGRTIRPLYVVDKNNELKIKKEDLNKVKNGEYDWKDLLIGNKNNSSKIEYLDVQESEHNSLICMTPEKLHDKKNYNYSHCELHPATILGICASTIPFCDHNQSPRNIYQSAMVKQSIGIAATNYRKRMDTQMHILYYPQKPLVVTQSMKYFNYSEAPSGHNAVVAIMTYTGYNQEDSIIFNQSAIDRGLFRVTYYKTYNEELKRIGGDKFTRPSPTNTINMKQYGSYEYLNDDGLITPGVKINHNDVVIGKVHKIDKGSMNAEHIEFKDMSRTLKEDSATVDEVMKGKNESGLDFVKVRLRMERNPQIGDKFSSRHGQKGVIGMTYRQEDMPFTASGIVPDIIINPHAIPSRMTVGQLIECVLGKISSTTGEEQDATPFRDIYIEDIKDELFKQGYDNMGNEVLYNGITGDMIQSEIFMGPTFYQRLKHMVKDKIHSRGFNGPIQMLTRQPAEGRARDGGLRLGEMERDCILAHGASMFLKERTMECSDLFTIHVCDICGMIAVGNTDMNLYECKACENNTLISAIQLPYACKLFLQEIITMGIYPKIVPE